MIKAIGSKFPLAKDTTGDICSVEKMVSCSTHSDLKPTWVHRDIPNNPYKYTSNLFVECEANEDAIGEKGSHGQCNLRGDIVVDEENEDIGVEKLRNVGKTKYGSNEVTKELTSCGVFGKHYHEDKTHIKVKCPSIPARDMDKIVNEVSGIAKRF